MLQTEPLTTLGIKRIYNIYDTDAYAAYDIVSNVIKCNSSGLKGMGVGGIQPGSYRRGAAVTAVQHQKFDLL